MVGSEAERAGATGDVRTAFTAPVPVGTGDACSFVGATAACWGVATAVEGSVCVGTAALTADSTVFGAAGAVGALTTGTATFLATEETTVLDEGDLTGDAATARATGMTAILIAAVAAAFTTVAAARAAPGGPPRPPTARARRARASAARVEVLTRTPRLTRARRAPCGNSTRAAAAVPVTPVFSAAISMPPSVSNPPTRSGVRTGACSDSEMADCPGTVDLSVTVLGATAGGARRARTAIRAA